MIRLIDIPNFGSFKSFNWNADFRDSHGNVVHFRRMNIMYGRNYSGKTTLSRIVRSIETKQIPKRFENPAFTVTTDVGVFPSTSIENVPFDVRVYNRDFIAEHLSFLVDELGEITPFAVIGKDNAEVEKEIGVLATRLGTDEPPTALRKSLREAAVVLGKIRAEESAAQNRFELKLTDKANRKPGGIKHDPLFRDPNYNITKLRNDIAAVRGSARELLDSGVRENFHRILTEKQLSDLIWSTEFVPKFTEMQEKVAALASQELRPSNPVGELLADPELQVWVKNGISLHREKRGTCGFCTGGLTAATWVRLDEHFDRAASTLEESIDACIREISAEIARAASIKLIEMESLYESLRPRARVARETLTQVLNSYSSHLEDLKITLLDRKKDLFSARRIERASQTVDTSLVEAINQYASIIGDHNGKSGTLAADQADASQQLRLDEVLKFTKDIDIDSEEALIKELTEAVVLAQGKHELLRTQVIELEAEIAQLRLRLKDESKGAAKVNQYLTHFFGHESLRLQNVEVAGGTGSRFKIFRGNTPAYNLSEGECSLVAFCYFMAKLEAVDAAGKELVVFIDDPISSLDENHIFFIYSLIESVVARRRRDSSGADIKDADGKPTFRYRQLFVATHNLDFLKYCKRLDRPKKDCGHFLVRSKTTGSSIEEMPPYLRDYVTEFNFLFAEICTCADPENATDHEHSFYGFGNNLRKFLEAYLFFKYPVSMGEREDHQRRVEQFFKGEGATEPLVQRVVNELSHLGERFDRSVQPIDIAEISKVAAFVLTTIRHRDPEQYSCLLESVEREDPLQENK
ncbi:MAG: AAA family ATPase [Gemmatimonadaceae bacterium]|nr:AAA family ATPase [Gemmatimonadaceae bacterium]